VSGGLRCTPTACLERREHGGQSAQQFDLFRYRNWECWSICVQYQDVCVENSSDCYRKGHYVAHSCFTVWRAVRESTEVFFTVVEGNLVVLQLANSKSGRLLGLEP
jgi:hypothetical protein